MYWGHRHGTTIKYGENEPVEPTAAELVSDDPEEIARSKNRRTP